MLVVVVGFPVLKYDDINPLRFLLNLMRNDVVVNCW